MWEREGRRLWAALGAGLVLGVLCVAEGALHCSSSSQCPDGQLCAMAITGDMLCENQSRVIGADSTLSGMRYAYCLRDSQCQGIGSRCVRYGWYGVCEMSAPEPNKPALAAPKRKGNGVNETCHRDADCRVDLQCVDFSGEYRCQPAVDREALKECDTDHQCSADEICIFSDLHNVAVCKKKAAKSELFPNILDNAEWTKSTIVIPPRPVNLPANNKSLSPRALQGLEYGGSYEDASTGAILIYRSNDGSVGSGITYGISEESGGGTIGTGVPYKNTTDSGGSGTIGTGVPYGSHGGGGDGGGTIGTGVPYGNTGGGGGDGSIGSGVPYGSNGGWGGSIGTGIRPYEQTPWGYPYPYGTASPYPGFGSSSSVPCENDYQCRPGESCTGRTVLNGVVERVCAVDQGKGNRLCFYNSDCAPGQHCEQNATGVFVCKTRASAEVAKNCVYDFECASGEKCVNVANEGDAKIFRCRAKRDV